MKRNRIVLGEGYLNRSGHYIVSLSTEKDGLFKSSISSIWVNPVWGRKIRLIAEILEETPNKNPTD